MAEEKVILSVVIDKGQAQKDAAQLTAEISKNTEARKELQKALKGLQVDEKRLATERGNSYQALLQLEKAGEGQTDQARLLRVEIARINTEYRENQSAIQKTSNELVTTTTEITANRRELRVLNRELEVNEGNLNAQRAVLSKAIRKHDEFRVGIDGTIDELKALGREIDSLNTDILNQEKATGRFQRQVGDYAGGIRQAFESAIPGAGNLSAALATPAGAVAGLVTAVGTGVVKLVEFQQKLEATRKEVELLTGATGSNLDNLTASIEATASVNNLDFKEVLISANSATEQLGGNLDDNLVLIQKGLASGANISGDFLDVLKEYPAQFKAAGLGLEEMIAISTQTTKAGVFSDKGVDTIKEATLRIREMPDATKSALDAIGLSGSEISSQLADGETTVFEVIQKVSGKLGELPPQSKEVGTAIADIFGGAGEDAGLEYIKTLKDVDLNLDNVLAKSGKFADQQFRLTQANQELNLLFNQLLGSADGFFAEAKIGATELLTQGLRGLINGLISIGNFFIEIYNNVAGLRIQVQFVFAAIRTAIDFVQFAINNFIDSIKSIGSIIVALVKGDIEGLKNAFKDAFQTGIQNAKDFGNDVAENYIEGFDNVSKTVDLIGPLGDGEAAKKKVKKIVDDITKILGEDVGGFDFQGAIDDALGEINLEGIESDNELLKLDTQSRISDLDNLLKQEDLLHAQQRAKGIADEEAHNLRLLELQREKLGLEAALLEEGSTVKTEKLTELANVEAQIFEEKETRKDEFRKKLSTDRKEREEAEAAEKKTREETEAADRAARIAQERAQEDASLLAASESVDTLIQLARTRSDDEKAQSAARKEAFDQQNALFKAATIAQKAIAAIEVGINLQREISSYWAASASAGPAAPAIAIPLTIAAVARGTAALANIARFNDGGFTGVNGIPDLQAPGRNITGYVHDNEYVVPEKVMKSPLGAAMVSQLEHIRLGNTRLAGFMNGGFTGVTPSVTSLNNTQRITQDITQNIEASLRLEKLEDAIRDMKIAVSVEDINAGIEREGTRKNRASV